MNYQDSDCTGWMPCLDKPVRAGWYQVTGLLMGKKMRMFDGEHWVKENGELMTNEYILQYFQWRGLNKEIQS